MKRVLFFICIVFSAVSFAQNRSDTIHAAHYSIDLSIVNLSQQTIDGYVDLKIVPQIVPLSYCDLDLAVSLTVDSVLHDNQTVNFSHSGTLLRIDFDNDVISRDTQSIRVYYHGKPAVDPVGGGFYFVGTMAFNFGAGLSIYPPSFGRSWFPCIDELTDKSTYTFHIRTDSDKMAVCGGILTDSATLGDQTKTWKWELNSPIPTYLASVAVGNFQRYKDDYKGINGDTIPIDVYATASYIGNVPGSFVNLKTVLRDYETRLGAYSWQRVGYVAVPFDAGAMEHATNITYPQFAVNGNTLYESIVFHELAHSWFGNLLTCGAAETMWINEGFATYAETMAEEALDTTLSRYKTSVRNLHRYVLKSVHTNDGGYFAVDSVPKNIIYGSTTYKKGGLVAHTLRHYLGDTLFFSGLRTLFQQNAYGNVNSEQFFTKMSQITGVDLMDFYYGWVHQPGFLHFSIDSVVKNEQTAAQYRLYFKQKLYHARYFADNNKVDVEFVSPQGERHTVRHITFSGEKDCVEVTLPFTPAFWVIDPDENLGDAVIKYPLTVSNTALIDCADAYFRLNPTTLTSNSEIRVEYHLVATDPLKTPNPDIFKLSDNNYWHIEFYDKNITDGDFRFLYDARANQRDYNLFQGYSRDNLILLYRRDAAQDWKIHPSTITGNTNGMLTTTSLLAGEYTLAMGNNVVSIPSRDPNPTVFIYPNPTDGQLRITNYEHPVTDIKIYDILGRLQKAEGRKQNGEVIIDISHFSDGVYIIKLKNSNNQEYTKKIVFCR